MLKFLVFFLVAFPLYAGTIYGNYNAGCIKDSIALTETESLTIMRPQRNHFWGHEELIHYLTNLSDRLAQTPWHGLLVGDLSQYEGGPLLNGHASHQIGLDADLWLTPKPIGGLTMYERKHEPAFSYVTPNMKVRKPWGNLHREFVLTVAEDKKVERIFINAALKKDLCDHITPDNPHYASLSKIRPWYGHDSHIHVRLKCPMKGGTYCVPQLPPSTDAGCGEELEWWFSTEARTPKKTTSASKKIKLPKQCQSIINH